jgi:hypothetical protein
MDPFVAIGISGVMIETHPILDCHTELRGVVELLLGNLSVYWKLTACVGTRTPTCRVRRPEPEVASFELPDC